LTGSLRTFYSAQSVLQAWRELVSSHEATDFVLTPRSARVMRSGEDFAWINMAFTFETAAEPQTECAGFLSLVPGKDGSWKIWLLRTVLEQLKGQPNVNELQPVVNSVEPAVNGIHGHSATNASLTVKVNGHGDQTTFDCVVVGAGQAGLGTAGRLKALGVSYVVLDRNAKVGDNWMLRYDSARLHTVREYAHLPFNRTFPLPYQEFLTKHDLAKGYQAWVDTFDINVWLSTNVESGSWDEERRLWTLNIGRNGSSQVLTCRHVVMAVGAGGQVPVMPQYPDRELFQGDVLHSAQFKTANPWKGRVGIVVGTANTAHDVAEDMLDADLSSVTMIQRGTTDVLPYEYFQKFSSGIYNEHVPTEVADRISYTMPLGVGRLSLMNAMHAMAAKEPERFDALERAGFRVERYPDLSYALSERLGGHYIDVGASKKIGDGLVGAR